MTENNKISGSAVSIIILLVFIITLFDFSGSRTSKVMDFDKVQNEGYIAFIVNEYSEDTSPDDDEAQECDGSGFITHGDGHKTPCPGCKNCEKGENPSTADIVLDEEIIIAPEPVITVREDTKQIIYFGASWCDFCVRFTRNEVPKLMARGLMTYNEDGEGIRAVDVHKDKDLAERYKKTRSVPEFVKTVNGKFQSSRTGYMSAEQIERWLNE